MLHEILIAIPSDVEAVHHVRGTVIVSSLRSLRSRNLLDAYRTHLAPEMRGAVDSITASAWYPTQLAFAHYQACDALALPPDVITEIGSESGRFINESVVSVAARVSREAGTSPWTLLGLTPRLIARTWQGGAIGVTRVGPKEARLYWAGQPCASIAYFRAALAPFIEALVKLFARTGYVRALPFRRDADRLAYACSWA